MTIIATIKALYLYPVKSMRGISVPEGHLTINGFAGDRRYAFVREHAAATGGFPWLTGRDKPRLILHEPRFERMPTPEDWDVPVRVQTPNGADYDVNDPRLGKEVAALYGQPVMLLKTKRGNFDNQHVSLLGLPSVAQLETESATTIDPRQFRANLYIEPANGIPFTENDWVGKILRVGSEAIVGVTKKDSRCVMINLDPATAVQDPAVLRTVTDQHGECIGIYANVVVPGLVRVGDGIEMM